MKRDLDRLTADMFDLLVIGAVRTSWRRRAGPAPTTVGDVGSRERPEHCARLAAPELGRDAARAAREIDATRRAFVAAPPFVPAGADRPAIASTP